MFKFGSLLSVFSRAAMKIFENASHSHCSLFTAWCCCQRHSACKYQLLSYDYGHRLEVKSCLCIFTTPDNGQSLNDERWAFPSVRKMSTIQNNCDVWSATYIVVECKQKLRKSVECASEFRKIFCRSLKIIICCNKNSTRKHILSTHIGAGMKSCSKLGWELSCCWVCRFLCSPFLSSVVSSNVIHVISQQQMQKKSDLCSMRCLSEHSNEI